MMFGKVILQDQRLSVKPGKCVLEIQDVAIEDYRLKMSGINLTVCNGEVIGLAGMEGSGQGLFLRACAGLLRPVGGSVFIHGENMTGQIYRSFLQKGVAYLPASRLEEGLVSGLTLSEHFSLSKNQSGFFIDRKQALAVTNRRIQEFNIHGSAASPVEALSGGNQQRALLALLQEKLSLILLEHPTRGLDIESSIYIWRKLKARCHDGTAIVFISSDLEEVLNYSDRILVFFSGRVSQPIAATRTSVEELGELIGGRGWASLANLQDADHAA
jgi:simple sugar transport system ATP-binding protein